MKLIQSTALVSALTFTSRIFGFIRESVIARVFGASAATDAFLVAFRIPNLLRQLFSEGAFASAFVPVLGEYKATRTPEEMKRFVDCVCGTLAAALLVVVGLGIACAPWIVTVLAPGYWDDAPQAALTADLLRITFGYIFFVSLCGFAAGIMNTHRRFAVPALTPIVLNVAMIFGALVLSKYLALPIEGLAWGVLLGGLVQLVVQIPTLRALGLLPRPRWGWKDSGVRKVLRLMVPSIFGVSVAQINMLVDVAIATALVTGSVTWLSNADRLIQLPQGVFGVALSAVILPHLSGRFAKQDSAGFSASLDWALRIAMVIAVPALITLVILANPIIWSVFGYGKYTASDVQMAGWSLALLALGLPAFISVKVLAPAFYSRQDTRTPVKAAMASLISNIFLNGLFVVPALYFAIYPAHAGMSLASATAGYINAGLLLFWLARSKAFDAQPGWAKFGLQLALASSILVAWFLVARALVPDYVGAWQELRASLRFLMVIGIIGIGALLYLGTLWLGGLNPKQFIDRGSESV